MANPVKDQPYLFEQLTADNCALLLIDHQAGLFLGVQSMDQQVLKNNAIALAKMGRAFDLPTVLFTSSVQGPNGPTIPEIKALYPDHEMHDRSPINLWEDPKCRAAVTSLGRKKLLMAAITTDVCLALPALAATAAGYEVYAVIDASGTWSTAAEMAAMFRMSQAGVIMSNWIAIAAEIKHDENRPTTPAMNQVYGEHMALYDFMGNIAAAKAPAAP